VFINTIGMTIMDFAYYEEDAYTFEQFLDKLNDWFIRIQEKEVDRTALMISIATYVLDNLKTYLKRATSDNKMKILDYVEMCVGNCAAKEKKSLAKAADRLNAAEMNLNEEEAKTLQMFKTNLMSLS